MFDFNQSKKSVVISRVDVIMSRNVITIIIV